MYLSEPTLLDTVKKQYHFKLNAHSTALITFMLLQIGALFLSFTNNKYTIEYASFSNVSTIHLSNDLNVILAIIWAFFLGIMLTTVVRRNEAFSFVTTRLSNHLANFLFMLTASLFAGIIATLTGPLLKLFGFLFYKEMILYTPSIVEAPIDFSLRIITATAYVLLFFLIGYTISSLIQLNKLFLIGFVILFIAFSSSTESWNGAQYFADLFMFFAEEQSLPFFILKISGAVLGLFAISTFITNRLEVRN